MVQVALQPSPEARSPSSHASLLSRIPFPQSSQGIPCTGQNAPGSVVQALEQPSPSVALPSSQASPGCTLPSPHVVQVPPTPALLGQIQPASMTKQSFRHPSALAVLPSSQTSGPSIFPSPQSAQTPPCSTGRQ